MNSIKLPPFSIIMTRDGERERGEEEEEDFLVLFVCIYIKIQLKSTSRLKRRICGTKRNWLTGWRERERAYSQRYIYVCKREKCRRLTISCVYLLSSFATLPLLVLLSIPLSSSLLLPACCCCCRWIFVLLYYTQLRERVREKITINAREREEISTNNTT